MFPETTFPIMTSSTALGDTPARSSAPLIAAAPSCGALMDCKVPLSTPIGVRAAPTMKASTGCVILCSSLFTTCTSSVLRQALPGSPTSVGSPLANKDVGRAPKSMLSSSIARLLLRADGALLVLLCHHRSSCAVPCRRRRPPVQASAADAARIVLLQLILSKRNVFSNSSCKKN